MAGSMESYGIVIFRVTLRIIIVADFVTLIAVLALFFSIE